MPSPTPSESFPDLLCACATARRAARVLTQLYDGELRRSGVEAAQFQLLTALDHRPGASQASLGRAFALDKTTLSRNFQLLRKKGWIQSAPAKDERERGFRLTRAGRERLAAARPCWSEAQQRLQSSMTPSQWKTMFSALRTVTMAAAAARRNSS